MYRFCRIPFGVISSPFLLSATIKHHLQHNVNPTAKLLLRDTYVDNVITGANSLEEAKELYTEAKKLFSTASMNLREWASSSQLFMAFVPVQDRVTELDHQRVLGINWNAVTDELSVSNTETCRCIHQTRNLANHYFNFRCPWLLCPFHTEG